MMKRVALILLTLAAFFAKPNLGQAQGYELTFEIKDLSDSIAYLAQRYGDKNILVDTTVVQPGGKVVFKGKETLPGGIYSVVNQRKAWLFEFLVDDVQKFSASCDTTNPGGTLKFKGSKQNDALLGYRSFITAKGSRQNEIRSQLGAMPEEDSRRKGLEDELKKNNEEVTAKQNQIIKELPGSLMALILEAQRSVDVPAEIKKDQKKYYRYYKEHFWDNINFSDDRLVRTPIYDNKLKEYFKNLVFQHPDSTIVDVDRMFSLVNDNKEYYKYTFIFLYQKYNSSKVMCIDKVFVHLALKYYTKEKAFWATESQLEKIRSRAMELAPIRCGEIAPEISLVDTNRKYHSLQQFDAEWTLLVFWDPNCGHCKKEIPWLYSKRDSLNKAGIKVYSVTTQQDEPDWRTFIQKHDLLWLNVTDVPDKNYQFLNNFREVYDIFSTPKTFLLDKNKVIRAKGFGVKQIHEVYKGVLEEQKQREENKKNKGGG